MEFKQIAINSIAAKNNYRKTFNDKSLKELRDSIAENGVLEPILVRPNGTGSTYELIAGERRLRASELAGLVTIPAIVREADDETLLRLQLVENLQRENVPYMETARGIRRLRDEAALTVDEIAKQIGKSTASVYNFLSLTTMAEEAQEAAERGEIGYAVAICIARLPNRDLQAQAAIDLARKGKKPLVTDRAAKDYLAALCGKRPKLKRPRRNAVQKTIGHDYAANWKQYLVRFSPERFSAWQAIVRDRLEIAIWAEAVESVMLSEAVR